MVGQQPLELLIQVRILVPQPFFAPLIRSSTQRVSDSMRSPTEYSHEEGIEERSDEMIT